MVGFTVACEWEASFLTTRSDSRSRGLEMDHSSDASSALLTQFLRVIDFELKFRPF